MTTTIFRQTIIICWDEEQQAYIADASDLPSCTGSGATYAEALASALEWWQERTRAHAADPPTTEARRRKSLVQPAKEARAGKIKLHTKRSVY